MIAYWQDIALNHPCFILGNAPSINDHDLSILDGYLTIGVNRIFRVYDPTILLWQDSSLRYDPADAQGIDESQAIKVCRDQINIDGEFEDFELLTSPQLSGRPDRLYGGRASHVLAWSLAYAMGCDPIVMVGTDCAYRGDQTDFWGINMHHHDDTLVACSRGVKLIQQWSKRTGRTTVNCGECEIEPKQKLNDVVGGLRLSGVDWRKKLMQTV